MKKFVPVFIAFAMVFGLLFAGYTPALAAKWDDPVVTPLTGDTEFTVTLLDPSKVGSYKGDSGLTIPEGYLDGEEQFGGKLLGLADVGYGTQKLCFAFPAYPFGWRGFIAKWDGAKWVKLETSVTAGKESAPDMACTTIYGNGTYGLIIGYSEADAPGAPCLLDMTGWNLQYDGGVHRFYVDMSFVAGGTFVTYRVIGISPAGSIELDGAGRGTVGNYLPGDVDFYSSTPTFHSPGTITFEIRSGGCLFEDSYTYNPG
jgi:hypothetical protein